MFFSIVLLLLPLFAQAESLLPAGELPRVCLTHEATKQDYWRQLVASKIDARIAEHSTHGTDKEVVTNALVTQSYQELFDNQGSSQSAQVMGYIYANASHHLGRLVRYHYWPEESALAKADKELISGTILQLGVVVAPKVLSQKLMHYSLALYKELAWSLLAASSCGEEFTSELVRSDHLRQAYRSRSVSEFIHHFIAFEQNFLQETMYEDKLIKLVTKLGALDKMRFISFNGDRNDSFYDWCKATNCDSTSYDLELRVEFDRVAVYNEESVTGWERETLKQRNANSQLADVIQFVLAPIHD